MSTGMKNHLSLKSFTRFGTTARRLVAACVIGALAVAVLYVTGVVGGSKPAKADNGVTTPIAHPFGANYVYPYAGTETLDGPFTYNENWLYENATGSYNGYFDSYDADGNLTAGTATRLTTTTVGTGSGQGGDSTTTLAVDSGGLQGRPKVFYNWGWASTPNATAAEIGGSFPSNYVAGQYTTMWAYPAQDPGDTTGAKPSQVYFIPDPDNLGAGTPYTNYWSGGEVDQNTGRIYFSGGEGSNIRTTFEMLIFDPATGNLNPSGLIQPATATDQAIFSSRGQVASDMVVDAAGNAYIVVQGTNAVNPSTGATQNTDWLVKVTPGTPATGGNVGSTTYPVGGVTSAQAAASSGWTYSAVTPLWDYNGSGPTAMLYNAWGMGFLNGKLYANFATPGYPYVSVINTLTGAVTRLSGTVAPQPQDYGSPQSAAVLNGTVYNDENGNGQVDGSEAGYAGLTVQLYDSTGTVVGQQITNSLGQYSFLLPGGSGTSDYYARVVQPQVNGANAVQTFAAVSSLNGYNPGTLMSRGGADSTPGRPATPYVDPAAKALGGVQDLSQVAAYTKVTVTTSYDITTADFGVSSQGSYGDASPTYKSTIAQNGPQHVEGPTGPNVWLGDTDGSYPDGNNLNNHASDDGVTLSVAGQPAQVNGQILAVGKNYEFDYTVNGSKASGANVLAWLGTTNGTTFPATASATGSAGALRVSVPTTPAPSGGLSNVYLRVNATTNPAVTAPDNTGGQYAPTFGSTASNTQTWTSDGETEDYNVAIANAVVRLTVQTDSAGTYTYTLSNVNNASPSSTSDQLGFTSPGIAASNIAHAVTTTGSDVQVVGAVPAGLTLRSATLLDTATGGVLGTITAPATGPVVIPGSYLAAGADVTVKLVYGKQPSAPDSTLAITNSPAPADGATPAVATVTVKASDGTLLLGQTVKITAPSDVTVGSVTDNGDGTYSADLTSTRAGTYAIAATAEINGVDTPVHNSPQNATFQATNAVAEKSSFSVDPASKTANGTDTLPVTVKTNDISGNPTAGTMVLTITASATDPTQPQFVGHDAGKPQQITVTTDDTATATVSITSTKEGTYQVSAALGGDPVPLAAAPNNNDLAKFVPGPPDITAPTTTWVVSPVNGDVNADGSSAFTGVVTVTDKDGNAYEGATVQVDVPANVIATNCAGGILTPASGRVTLATTDANGKSQVCYTSTTAGKSMVDAYLVAPAPGGQIGTNQQLSFISMDADPAHSS
ncbi:MAG: Ig-like domain-containing protein, partial [Actinomycetia bacterium]|nr:Ig-like domain-containing protein [Actinomycetes bacterium]